MTDKKRQSNLEHLRVLRTHELAVVIECLQKLNISTKNISLLEIGAGTGVQASELERLGFRVSAIDVAESNYAGERVRPVLDYDGHHIPFPDRKFDLVYSSNVLEHIPHASEFQREIHRVLKDDGFAIHVLPSAPWRFWTNLSYYLHVLRSLGNVRGVKAAVDRRQSSAARPPKWKVFAGALLASRHGERGNSLSEMWYFSRRYWAGFFRDSDWEIVSTMGCGVFYTGYSILGSTLSIPARRTLATVLGDATNLFVLRKCRPAPK